VRIAKLEREAASLVEAIATGMLRTSPAIAKRLAATEETLAQLRAQPGPRSVEQLLPDLEKRIQTMLDNLEETLMRDPRRGRAEIAEHVGPIRVRATPEEILLEAQKGHVGSVLLTATGTDSPRQISVVAGAGFDAYLEVRLG
jgi:hypothetical protein